MEFKLKITCTCHQVKIAICCQTPLVALIAPKICTRGVFNMLYQNLPSDLFSAHSSNTSSEFVLFQADSAYQHTMTEDIGCLPAFRITYVTVTRSIELCRDLMRIKQCGANKSTKISQYHDKPHHIHLKVNTATYGIL